ncbi:hypothetical protein DI09_498p10, partial [Mitosporidium daphniae]
MYRYTKPDVVVFGRANSKAKGGGPAREIQTVYGGIGDVARKKLCCNVVDNPLIHQVAYYYICSMFESNAKKKNMKEKQNEKRGYFKSRVEEENEREKKKTIEDKEKLRERERENIKCL